MIENEGMRVIIATWSFGLKAVEAGWRVLDSGGSALDTVEVAIREIENDLAIRSVGLGGFPNIDGVIELDAAIMDGRTLRAGAVAAVRNVRNPISLARKVMEETPHILIAGSGATELAKYFGLFVENVNLQPEVEKIWLEKVKRILSTEPTRGSSDFWLKLRALKQDEHDTIGVVALDSNGNLAAGTSTSGTPFKLPGRVGDSSLIGSGLFANEFGGAAATGHGENIMIHNLSRLVVEEIESGFPAGQAANVAINKVLKYGARTENIAVIALDRNGNYGAASTHEVFEFAVMSDAIEEPKILSIKRGQI